LVTIEIFRNEQDTLAIPAGQTIFNEGDSGNSMYVVVEGNVDLLVKGKLVESLGPGGVLGEMALLDNIPRSAGAIAKTDCRLVEINEKRFKFLIQQTPNFALQLMRVIADRLRRMDDRLA
jgi:CRP/FNR family cyclic AMP-dependent transcriptional regulator